jgi:hypothetical protein
MTSDQTNALASSSAREIALEASRKVNASPPRAQR